MYEYCTYQTEFVLTARVEQNVEVVNFGLVSTHPLTDKNNIYHTLDNSYFNSLLGLQLIQETVC